MAWTLCEESLKAVAAFVAVFLLKTVGGRMVNTIKGETSECCIANCRRVASRRGMCLVCYGKAKKKVESGEVTWDKLESMDLCKPDGGADPFDDAYSKATH